MTFAFSWVFNCIFDALCICFSSAFDFLSLAVVATPRALYLQCPTSKSSEVEKRRAYTTYKTNQLTPAAFLQHSCSHVCISKTIADLERLTASASKDFALPINSDNPCNIPREFAIRRCRSCNTPSNTINSLADSTTSQSCPSGLPNNGPPAT